MSSLENVEIGDLVFVGCWATERYLGTESVKELIVKHDRGSGEPYPVIVLANGHQFDATTGNAVSPQTSHYICEPSKPII
jgi:hypothetical protein